MDREIAIGRIKAIKTLYALTHMTNEALDLAIEALQESQTTHDQMDACYMAQKSAVEKLQLSGETSTISEKESVEGDAESATSTNVDGYRVEARSISKLDCISRQQAIEAMCRECCIIFPDDEVDCPDCTEVAVLKNLPPVNQKQITSKLESAENATSEGEESTMNQPKSKLDCISRQEAVAYINRIINSGLGKNKSLDYIRKYISALPPVTPTDKVQQADMLIIAAALRYFAQDSERNISDRERAEELRKQVLAYGASMCKPVTPTERTGEWVKSAIPNELYVCSECGGACWSYDYERNIIKSNYCPNCGCAMTKE